MTCPEGAGDVAPRGDKKRRVFASAVQMPMSMPMSMLMLMPGAGAGAGVGGLAACETLKTAKQCCENREMRGLGVGDPGCLCCHVAVLGSIVCRIWRCRYCM